MAPFEAEALLERVFGPADPYASASGIESLFARRWTEATLEC